MPMVVTGGGRVEGTREAILGILRRRDGVSVDVFADELGLAGATVRRHLDVLLRDGLVSVEQERGRTGRPRYAFSLTESGAEQFPHHYVRLTHRLLDEIVQLDTGETEGRDGTALADLLFDKMSGRLAGEYASRVSGETLEERVRSAAALLAEEGLDFDVEAGGEVGYGEVGGSGIVLLGRGCPCARFASGRDVASCDHDRQLLEDVIGSPVSALKRADLPSEFLCGYRVGG
ncbi:MAG: helix-turn-helix domain-containing protein [Dehalococcoidia bacterium]|nr:helix-turn-helix domain-containing protein [Dehalococcoidia bacterium]